MFVLLDAGPLGQLINPNPTRKTREIQLWMRNHLANGVRFAMPESSDYEVRRNLILENLVEAIDNLNALKTTIHYIPLSTDIMLKAADLWADVKGRGIPTAHPEHFDFDVVLAAQAIITSAGVEQVVIATQNVGHLERFNTATVTAAEWRDVT